MTVTAVAAPEHPDRVWRIVRWLVAVLALAAVGLGAATLHYAKKASSNNTETTSNGRSAIQVAAQVAKIAVIVTATQKLVQEVQKTTSNASQQVSTTSAAAQQ